MKPNDEICINAHRGRWLHRAGKNLLGPNGLLADGRCEGPRQSFDTAANIELAALIR
jgi:hypothetical protein